MVCGLPALVCSTNCPLQDEHYTWDNKGNLLSRSRGATNTENFKYDANDRVTLGWYSMLGGTSYPTTPPANPASDVNVTEWMSYAAQGCANVAGAGCARATDKLGNICQRMGTDGTVNAYTYSQLGGCGTAGLPGGTTGTVASGYRLLKVAGSAINETYATDANGSMTVATSTTGTVLRGWNYAAQGCANVAGAGCAGATDTQNRAVEVYKGATPAAATLRTRWDYDASGARFRRTDDGTGSGGGSTTLYLDNVERVTTGSSVTWRRTVAGVAVMALVGTNPTLPTTNYLLHDHIGSVVAVANSSGALVERGDYSAFGGMRTAIDGVQVGLAALATTTRGFTGHEQLGSLDLIHMNGRIYDPLLGRFLQADPMVQSPGNPQNWNPYSYVFNNPLANTDPTGMFSVSQFFRWAPVVLDVLAFLVPAWAPVLLPLAQAIRTLGAVYGIIKGGIAGAFTAAANYEFGITGAAIAAGVVSESRGGSFWAGARREAVSDLESAALNFAESQIEEGVKTAQSGGKFANGADSATTASASGGCGDAKGNPEDPSYKLANINKKWFDEGKVWAADGIFHIDLTVSGPDSAAIAQATEATWNGKTGTYDGQDYTISMHLTPVSSHGDWVIIRDVRLTSADLTCNGTKYVGGLDYNGTNRLHIPPVSEYANEGSPEWVILQAAPHEFGHALGLTHALNSIPSEMNYLQDHTVTSTDVGLLLPGYMKHH